MSKVINTRLRYIRAEKIEDIEMAVNMLQFKIEIKGAPIKSDQFWVLFFVIPDNVEFKSIDLMR